MYLVIKYIHVSCVILSITGFIIRGVWMIRDSQLQTHPMVKILPHVIDAILLTSALILIFIVEQYPFHDHWLTVKVLALIAYIFLGMFAFKWAKKKPGKIIYWALAIFIFVYIVSVALTKTPLWFIN